MAALDAAALRKQQASVQEQRRQREQRRAAKGRSSRKRKQASKAALHDLHGFGEEEYIAEEISLDPALELARISKRTARLPQPYRMINKIVEAGLPFAAAAAAARPPRIAPPSPPRRESSSRSPFTSSAPTASSTARPAPHAWAA